MRKPCAFKLSRGPGRAEYAKTGCLELVGQPCAQGRLGANHGKVRLLALRPGQQAGNILGRNFKVFAQLGRASVAGRAEQTGPRLVPAQFPSQGMLASAAADQE